MFDLHNNQWPLHAPHHLTVPETTVDFNLSVSASRYPDKNAICYYGGAVTYAELDRQVSRLAAYLQKCLDVKKADRVLLYMQNSPQFIIGYYAILRAGGVVIPANPMNAAAELEHLAADTGATLALAAQELLPRIEPLLNENRLTNLIVASYSEYADMDFDLPLPDEVRLPAMGVSENKHIIPWAEAVSFDGALDPVKVSPDDLACIPYSSGTTGAPKGCVHTHRTVMTTAVGGVTWIPQSADNPTLVSLPMFHVTGMQNSMNGSIYVGTTMVVATRWDRATAAHLIEKYAVSRWVAISTMVIDLLNDPDIQSYDLSSLDIVSGGGAPMPEAVALRLEKITGQSYLEGYGLSETMAATHINPLGHGKKQCLGIPVFDVDCRILSIDGKSLLGPNEEGEIITHAPQVFKGYWNNPEATEQAFITIEGKAFFKTGDIGYYDSEGFFFLVDRVKRMINAAGFKVWPAEVESLMHKHPAINEVVIVGKPDARRGETVKALVSLRKGHDAEPLAPEDIIGWCHDNMAAYKCPKSVEFVDALPKSATGKVLWKDIQARERQRLELR